MDPITQTYHDNETLNTVDPKQKIKLNPSWNPLAAFTLQYLIIND